MRVMRLLYRYAVGNLRNMMRHYILKERAMFRSISNSLRRILYEYGGTAYAGTPTEENPPLKSWLRPCEQYNQGTKEHF